MARRGFALHGGPIRLETERDKGSTFTFMLPLRGVQSPGFNLMAQEAVYGYILSQEKVASLPEE